jgi:predicted RNA binding protein YcfA (HicA-like mRNA interferase family)
MVELTNSRQRKTLYRIFKEPTPNDIPWSQIESLFKHIGFEIEYGMGSRVKMERDDETFTCHRPHPSSQTNPDTIRDIRDFLAQVGVRP